VDYVEYKFVDVHGITRVDLLSTGAGYAMGMGAYALACAKTGRRHTDYHPWTAAKPTITDILNGNST
jgi:hypothetical protein